VTIGRHGVISAEQAREKAVQILAELARGINPNTEQRQERKEKKKAIDNGSDRKDKANNSQRFAE
jgi:hypothetical protein